MKRAWIDDGMTSRFLLMLMLTAALISIGCDNNINVTEPHIPGPEADSEAVVVVGTMSADQGTCNKATILFDRQELEGARTECANPDGCTQLELESDYFWTRIGPHTVAFKVLSQSQDQVTYTIEGEVSALRDAGDRIPLGPVTTTLGPGESYTFPIGKLPWLEPPSQRPEDL